MSTLTNCLYRTKSPDSSEVYYQITDKEDLNGQLFLGNTCSGLATPSVLHYCVADSGGLSGQR